MESVDHDYCLCAFARVRVCVRASVSAFSLSICITMCVCVFVLFNLEILCHPLFVIINPCCVFPYRIFIEPVFLSRF